MSSRECVILIILQGDKIIHEEPGCFDIWTVNKNAKTLVTIQNATTEEYIFEELPIESMSMSAPLVCIQIKRD